MSESKHPMQPVVKDRYGTVRFKENHIVRYLLDNGGIDLNRLAVMNFTVEDREQFAQLIGYSVSGYHELSYVSDESATAASVLAKELTGNSVGCRTAGCQIHMHNACESCGEPLGMAGCDICDGYED